MGSAPPPRRPPGPPSTTSGDSHSGLAGASLGPRWGHAGATLGLAEEAGWERPVMWMQSTPLPRAGVQAAGPAGGRNAAVLGPELLRARCRPGLVRGSVGSWGSEHTQANAGRGWGGMGPAVPWAATWCPCTRSGRGRGGGSGLACHLISLAEGGRGLQAGPWAPWRSDLLGKHVPGPQRPCGPAPHA